MSPRLRRAAGWSGTGRDRRRAGRRSRSGPAPARADASRARDRGQGGLYLPDLRAPSRMRSPGQANATGTCGGRGVPSASPAATVAHVHGLQRPRRGYFRLQHHREVQPVGAVGPVDRAVIDARGAARTARSNAATSRSRATRWKAAGSAGAWAVDTEVGGLAGAAPPVRGRYDDRERPLPSRALRPRSAGRELLGDGRRPEPAGVEPRAATPKAMSR